MNISQLKSDAAQSLHRASFSPHRLALIHTGIALAASLILTILNYILTHQIGNTAGLAGIGTRTVLSTVQSVLSVLLMAALPFWELGFTRAAVLYARQEEVTFKVLPEGFRRLGPALRLTVIRILFVGMIGFFCLQFATVLYILSPLSDGLMTQMEALMEGGQLATADPAVLDALLPSLYPVYILAGVLLIALLIPVFYRFRLADMAIMDDAPGALAALRLSGHAMKGKAFSYFKLDLSFWWYYLLAAASSALAYGDVLLAWLKVPANETVSYFFFYVLSLVCQLLLAWRFAPTVQTTYATAYLQLRAMDNA